MNKTSAAAVVGIGLVAQIALVAAPAYAASLAPTCITRTMSSLPSPVGEIYEVVVKNNCTTTWKVKVVIDSWIDSDCWSLTPGTSKRHTHQGRYNSTVLC
ncbi:hypothetical protein [Actinoplanes sp. NPDC049802]|uniref:hypothetical protein n=1 Tax=Actinoplanes sp. NPDC049802 TaxID=3154742 RepID=UPI0033D7DE0C